MADAFEPISGGTIPYDQQIGPGNIGNTGAFVETTMSTMSSIPDTTGFAYMYINANKIKILPGLVHHRIIIRKDNNVPSHYCKQISNVVDYDTMWYDNVSEELYKNAITYYYILCPNKRYMNNDDNSYNCRKDEVGLLSYSYINKYYDENNQQWDYGWGPNKYWNTIDSDTSTTQTGLLDTNVPYYEGFDTNDEETLQINVSSLKGANLNSSSGLTFSYGTFRLVNALADIDTD